MGRCQEDHLGGGKRLDAKLVEIKRDIRILSKTDADCNAFSRLLIHRQFCASPFLPQLSPTLSSRLSTNKQISSSITA